MESQPESIESREVSDGEVSEPEEIENSDSFQPGNSERTKRKQKQNVNHSSRSPNRQQQIDPGDINMQFPETAPRSRQSKQQELAKISNSKLNETPFGEDMVSNLTDHGNAAIDLSGASD